MNAYILRLNNTVEDRSVFWWGGRGISTEHTAYLNLKQGILGMELLCQIKRIQLSLTFEQEDVVALSKQTVRLLLSRLEARFS